jgi:CheY-like chemotaxis protein
MAEGIAQFREQMDGILERARRMDVSSKVRRYLRAYEAGLPQDVTVRWFPADDLPAIQARVDELVHSGREVWISQGLPWNTGIDRQLSSVEQRTDLIKGLRSLADFQATAQPRLQAWAAGSWAKVFYDSPQRALISGTIRIDTNRADTPFGNDMRGLRLEAAYGISDVRDLDRQMSASQIVIAHPDPGVRARIAEAVSDLAYHPVEVADPAQTVDAVLRIVRESKAKDDPRAKPSEPKALWLDFATSREAGLAMMEQLKQDRDAACLPVVPIVDDASWFPASLRAAVTTHTQLPVSRESVRQSLVLTGFRLTASTRGFDLSGFEPAVQRSIDGLLHTILGPGLAYLRMMISVANEEQRPTVAFEFKIVPQDPYDFFLLDYEWSGPKDPAHRFDWAYRFGDG